MNKKGTETFFGIFLILMCIFGLFFIFGNTFEQVGVVVDEGYITNKYIEDDGYVFELDNETQYLVSTDSYINFDIGDYVLVVLKGQMIFIEEGNPSQTNSISLQTIQLRELKIRGKNFNVSK